MGKLLEQEAAHRLKRSEDTAMQNKILYVSIAGLILTAIGLVLQFLTA